jgi:hypothetical protein
MQFYGKQKSQLSATTFSASLRESDGLLDGLIARLRKEKSRFPEHDIK